MDDVPGRAAARPLRADALSANSHDADELRAPQNPERFTKTPSEPAPTTSETDRLLAQVATAHTQSDDAIDAYDNLNRAIMLAREDGNEVSCLGPGWEAWTSDDSVDQELAADLCLLCPVFDHCEAYAETARPAAGTWAGITTPPMSKPKARKPRPRVTIVAKPRAPSVGPACTCGCGERTRGGRYLPGHDSCHVRDLLRQIRSREITAETAREALSESPRLRGKLDGYLRPAPLS